MKWEKFLKRLKELFATEVDEEKLAALLEIATANLVKPKERKEYIVYPGELSKCLKRAYLEHTQRYYKVWATPSQQAGNAFDKGLKQAIQSIQRLAKDIFIVPSYPVSGTIKLDNGDVIVISGKADFVSKNAVIELKTTSVSKFELKEDDAIQTALYAYILKKPKAFIVYVYRKFFFYKIFRLDEEDIRQYAARGIARAYILYKALKEGKPPEARPNTYCRGCPFLGICNEGKEYLQSKGIDIYKVLKMNYEKNVKLVKYLEMLKIPLEDTPPKTL